MSGLEGLRRIGQRPRLSAYIALASQHSNFSAYLGVSKALNEYSKHRLGAFWLVLRPLLNALMYGLIFGLLMGDRRPPNYISFLIIGVFLYEFFSRSVSVGAKSVLKQQALAGSISLPRILLPGAALVQNFLNFTISLGVMLLLLIIFTNPISLSWFLLIPIIFLFALMNFGVTLLFARLAVSLPDITTLIPFITRLGLYLSGVLFNFENLLGNYPTLMAVVSYNPVFVFINLARSVLLSEYETTLYDWSLGLGWAVVIFVIGVVFFWRGENSYGRK